MLITAAALTSVASSALALAGCSPTREIADDVYLDYDGEYRDAVAACALEAALINSRNGARDAVGVTLSDIGWSLTPETADARVEGILSATDATGEGIIARYAWKCTTDEGGGEPNIISFELVDEG
jgi:hypothetical protein